MLQVPLPCGPTFKQLLDRCSEVATDIPTRLPVAPVPITSELHRAALRSLTGVKDGTRNEKIGQKRSLPILSHGLLQSAWPPKAIPAEEQAQLKENLVNDLKSQDQDPHQPHHMIDVGSEGKLATVNCSLEIMAMDHEEGMLSAEVKNHACLWDTGAETTFITDDILPDAFAEYVRTNPIHKPYRANNDKGTRVQIACIVEFSNHKVVQVNTVATVVSSKDVPNKRSGIILGQNGLIESLTHRVVPRVRIVRDEPDFPEGLWGRIDLESYVNSVGEMRIF